MHDTGRPNLMDRSLLAGWPTPNANDQNTNRERPASKQARGSGGVNLVTAAELAGWPTPTSTDAERRGEVTPRPGMLDLNAAATLSGWPTPAAIDATSNGETAESKAARGSGGINLTQASRLAGWAAPKESDHRPDHASRAEDTSRINLNDQAMMAAGWATPQQHDAATPKTLEQIEAARKRATPRATGGPPGFSNLNEQALLAGAWPTPNERDYRTPAHKTYRERGGGAKGENLNHLAAHVIPGASLNGLPAQTESAGLLAPPFSAWLMGIPDNWLQSDLPPRASRSPKAGSSSKSSPSPSAEKATLPGSAPTATPSTPSRRRK